MAIYSGFSHQKWWFSIAMLVHQRVSPVSSRVILYLCLNPQDFFAKPRASQASRHPWFPEPRGDPPPPWQPARGTWGTWKHHQNKWIRMMMVGIPEISINDDFIWFYGGVAVTMKKSKLGGFKDVWTSKMMIYDGERNGGSHIRTQMVVSDPTLRNLNGGKMRVNQWISGYMSTNHEETWTSSAISSRPQWEAENPICLQLSSHFFLETLKRGMFSRTDPPFFMGKSWVNPL